MQVQLLICDISWMAVRLVARTKSVFRAVGAGEGGLVGEMVERQLGGGMWRVWRISRAEERQF